MRLTGKTRVAGVMGWPIGHSRSPRLHNFWLREYGIDGVYVPLAVHPDGLEAALRGLAALGLGGCNVTLPHKQATLRIVDEVEALARRIGAVNTVVVRSDGSLHGSNSDAFGFLAAIAERAPAWSPGAGAAVVLGAGGAARAIVAALLDAEVREVRLVNRTRARAEALAGDMADSRLRVEDWSARAELLAGARLLVNTTSLGMAGQPPLELALDALPADAVVDDIVYTPLETALLAAARARGNIAVDGLAMLLHQARPGFEAWFGVRPEVSEAQRADLLADIEG